MITRIMALINIPISLSYMVYYIISGVLTLTLANFRNFRCFSVQEILSDTPLAATLRFSELTTPCATYPSGGSLSPCRTSSSHPCCNLPEAPIEILGQDVSF